MFKPISSPKATQLIIKQIRNAILQGKIAPGQKLPSSSELMDKFNVSRATLREALRALEYLGLVDIRKGAKGGIYACEVDSKVSRESLINFFYFKNVSVQHLSEVRRILEPYVAKVAARKISAEGIDQLVTINQRCEAALAKGQHDKVSKDLIHFHRVIAQCTENPVLIFILSFVEDLLQETKDLLRPDSRFFETVVAAHKRIADALKDRDADRAFEEMYKDVSRVEEALTSIKNKSRLTGTETNNLEKQ